ncbi:putative PLP-dependent transferase [Rosellinia necatrix]|uniref:Putative PLP-dependent transferase n=1 Tax=Rosellinia necatrix TaxID=77044 RepID=A0A1S8ABW7_ROSNE|nr:putative PLP-dependent transferase [Rosellinia necatrix]
MSKDFCAAGFRLGVLHSRNQGLITAVSTISVLGWVPYLVQDIWADMLTDDAFRVNFMEKNRRLLKEHSAVLMAFLREHDIPYYTKANAGVFAWVNLQRYLYNKPSSPIPTLPHSDDGFYRDREMKLWNRLLAAGVGLGLGTWYSSEEPGWFRISFAVEIKALQIGLERLATTLREIEAEGWN